MKSEKCPKCHHVVSATDKFCPGCGTLIEKIATNVITCKKCNHENLQGIAFCEKCGKPLSESTGEIQNSNPIKNPHKIVSEGNYSGKMIKSKTSRSRKVFRNIIIIVIIVAIIAFIIWFNTDPNAKEKLSNILFGAIVMVLFGSYIWWRGKKGKIKASKNREANYDWDDIDEQDNDDFD